MSVYILLNQCLSYHAAPSKSPQNLSTNVISSTEIRLHWNKVPAIDQNGRIVTYEIESNQSQFLQNTSLTTSTPNLTSVLRGLHEFAVYTIRIRAWTSKGPGPYSLPVDAMTMEDGEITSIYSIQLLATSYHCTYTLSLVTPIQLLVLATTTRTHSH